MAELNPIEKLNILVTGPTGAIGRAVARELVINSYRVFGLVRNAGAQARLPYAVIPVRGDIREPERWEGAVAQCDVVVNLALPPDLSPPGPKHRDAALAEGDAMAEILDRLCTVVRKQKKILIHAFSALLYEPDEDGWVRETSAITKGRGFGVRHTRTWPVLVNHRRRGLKAITVNPAFVYGPGGWFEQDVLEPMSRSESTMIGDGTQTMHYIAAADAAAGFRLAIEKGIEGEDYLLADERPTTQGDFIRLVAKEMGAPEPTAMPEDVLAHSLGDWMVEAATFCPKVNTAKAKQHLGWAPRFRTIQEGIPIVVRDYRRAHLTAGHR
jgi:nucleoside-diphosphate-sugar epimerase